MAVPRRTGTSMSSFTRSAGYADPSEMDKYRLIENIGKGSFGVISKIQRLEDGKEFALKQLDYGKMTDRDRKQIAAEVAILESLKHRNIVQLVQKIADPRNERIYIVMEYCMSGDLGSLIRRAQRNNQSLHEDRIWSIFLQITLALDHCHWPADRRRAGSRLSNGGTSEVTTTQTQVLHRDLKPENVFLSGDFVKLGDFGLSKDMAGCTFTSTYVGTPLYMPPEILAENRYDMKSDIWSLGCLLFEMCALTSPFATAQTQEQLIAMVRSGKLPALPTRISPALKGVIKAMLSLNPVRRPSTKDLLEMDEMKYHHRLFKVQNQQAILERRKEELFQREAQVAKNEAKIKQLGADFLAKETELAAREEALRKREKELGAREQHIAERENCLRDNHVRITHGMEVLRDEWAKVRAEQQRLDQATAASLVSAASVTSATSAATGTSVASITTATSATSISAPASAVSTASDDEVEEAVIEAQSELPPGLRTPYEERKQLPVSSRFSRHPSYEDTPSKIPFPSAFASPAPLDARLTNKISGLPTRRPSTGSSLPRRLASKSLTNLVGRARADAEEYLMPLHSTPAKNQRGAPGTPGRHVPGRTSIGSPGELDRVFTEDVTMVTASFVGSPAPSVMTPFHARPRKSFSDDAVEFSTLPPTLIPAPTFVYRPEATPAKWSSEDPDCPSPFLRRGIPAPPALSIPNGQGTLLGTGTRSAVERERAPLSAINPQPPASALDPPTKAPTRKVRSKSGTLHRDVLRHNAARSDGSGTAGATTATTAGSNDFMPAGAGTGLGPAFGSAHCAVRSRNPVGRDPARC